MIALVKLHGTSNWGYIATALQAHSKKGSIAEKENIASGNSARLSKRSGKQCRERWYNQLDPRLTKEAFSKLENEYIIYWQSRIGKSLYNILNMFLF